MAAKEETKLVRLSSEEETYRLKNQFKSLGLASALDALHISRESFVVRYGEVLGGEAEAKKVYDWAIETADQVAKHYHAGSRLEKMMELSAVNRSTPNVTVLDNRGLSVRQLGYYRREEKEIADVRISVQRYDNRGQLLSVLDPRLSNAYLKDPVSVTPNQQQQSSLLGGVLQSENMDAGKRVVLSDCRGKALWSCDSRGIEREFEYDVLGRVQSVHEKEQGKERICSERLLYGDPSNTEKGQNAVGQLLAAYGSSGYSVTTEYSVLGQLKKESQTFLKADQAAQWTEAEVENQNRLEEASYVTENQSNALGEMVSQIDAKGNERQSVYDVSGQIETLKIKLKSGTEKILSKDRLYSAQGQLEKESLGNGIQMHYRYEAATQRLSEKEAKRVSDHQSLQYLHYTYDPVGNILSIEDRAKAIEHFSNEKTEPINHYAYDSFYQLIESQGLESSQAGKETPKLPQAIPLGTSDASRLVNYKRTYQYDAGGNLYHIQHHGTSPYTQKLEIDKHSNRGIEEREPGPTLKESFDGNGNLLYLNVGQPLSWDTRNQLKQVTQLERESTADKEEYVYDSQGNRVEKRRNQSAQNQIHTERVRYLPGIEIREKWQTDSKGKSKKIKEALHVIQAQAGEPIRVLQWEKGKPKEIENETVYYSLSDQIGSNQLELNESGEVVSYEFYYPYGGTAIWATKNQVETDYKYQRYSGKERDATGLYYYGYRYYIPWLGRWVNADPSGIAEGLNLFQMVNNNPIIFYDPDGRAKKSGKGAGQPTFKELYPHTEIDDEGKIFRHIREIGGFSDNPFVDISPIKVDVRVYEHNISTKGVYLFTGSTRAESLVIFTHGSFHRDIHFEYLHLEENTPSIVPLGPHGKVLYSNAFGYKKSYAEVSHRGIILSSKEADQHLKDTGYATITGAYLPERFANYTLSKFETDRGGARKIGLKHGLEALMLVVNESRREFNGEPVDMLSIRKYRAEDQQYRNQITLKDIITFAIEQNYKKIILNFCRSCAGGPSDEKDIFSAKSLIPVFDPGLTKWTEMKADTKNPFD